jgi:release factor glutamine methyltransferase
MIVKEYLARSRERLAGENISDHSIESELLLRQALSVSTIELYLLYDGELTLTQQQTAEELIQRRLSGEPSAYIRGEQDFYGLEFYVRPSVLIPRPETELIVEKAIHLAEAFSSPIIADIGVGSGVIAVTLAKYLPLAEIFAIDISRRALDIARLNAERHGLANRIVFLHGSFFSPLTATFDILVANLPYVKSGELPNHFEPALALDGGLDGLRVIDDFCRFLPGKLRPGGSLLMEIGQGQTIEVTRMLREALPRARISVDCDLAGIERVVTASQPLKSTGSL